MESRQQVARTVALVAMLLMVGCGTSTANGGAAPTTSRSVSISPTAPVPITAPTSPLSTGVLPPRAHWPTMTPGDFTPEVVWHGSELIVTAFGSRQCQPVPRSAAAADSHTVVVTFESRPKGVACTDDFAPHVSRLPAPAGGIDLNSDVYAAFDLAGAPQQLIPVQLDHPTFS